MIIPIMLVVGVFILIQHSGLFIDIAPRGTLTLSIDVTPSRLRPIWPLAESNNRFDFFGRLDVNLFKTYFDSCSSSYPEGHVF